MRGQMENRADYTAPLAIGDVMRARGVGEIVASKNPDLPVGALAWGIFGMQDKGLAYYQFITKNEPSRPILRLTEWKTENTLSF